MAKSVANIIDVTSGIMLLVVPVLLAFVAFPMLLLQSTSIVGMLADDNNVIYIVGSSHGKLGTQVQIEDPRVGKAVDIALRDPLVSSILSGAKWELGAAIPVLDYDGFSLVFKLDRPVFINYEFKQWYNPLGSMTIKGWTTQLIVDVNLEDGKVVAVIPTEPDSKTVPPTKELASKLGKLGGKVLEGARILEEYKGFNDVDGVEARAFWVASYGPVKKAYYHIFNGDGEIVGVGCIDLNLMVVDKSCTGKIMYIDSGAANAIADEARLVARTMGEAREQQVRIAFSPQPIYRYGDSFYNYDFNSMYVSSSNVDWPINLVFFRNANVNKVKGIYLGIPGSTKYAYLNDGYGWYWDSDRGVKPIINAGTQCGIDLGYSFLHLRIYADSDDKLWNYKWGNYVIVTAHIDDIPEIPGITPAGFNEAAENIASSIASSKGYQVYYDYDYFDNYVGYCIKIGHKYYWNYGYADFIKVP